MQDITTKLEDLSVSVDNQLLVNGSPKRWSSDSEGEETVPIRDFEDEDAFYDEEGEGEILPPELLDETHLSPQDRDKLLASKLALEHEWVFWYDDKLPKGMSSDKYASAVKSLGKFATVQDFWRYWNSLEKIVRYPEGTNLRMFKAGIKPMWEDPANERGGKWVVNSSNKDATHKIWSKLVLALIGEQFEYSDDFCGVVLSVRPRGDTISIWNRSGDNPKEIETTAKELRALLGCQSAKYQLHQTAEKGEKMDPSQRLRKENGHNSRSKSLDFDRLPSNHKYSLNRKHNGSGNTSRNSSGRSSPSIGIQELHSESVESVPYPILNPESLSKKTLEIERGKGFESKFVKAEPQSPKTNRAAMSPNHVKQSTSTVGTPVQNTPTNSPMLKKKSWGDWSDIGFASSDESGASDRDSPLVKKAGKIPQNSASQSEKITQPGVITQQEVAHLEISPATTSNIADHKSEDSLGEERIIAVKETSVNKGKSTVAPLGNHHEPPTFSAGRGAILRRNLQTPEPIRKPKVVGTDTDFIKQMEANRNDPPKENNDSNPKPAELGAGEEEGEVGSDEELESKRKLPRKSKTAPTKQTKVVKKAKSSSRHKNKTRIEEDSSLASDYIYIFLGLVIMFVLTYLYQTQYLTKV